MPEDTKQIHSKNSERLWHIPRRITVNNIVWSVDTLRSRLNGRQFAEGVFKYISLKDWISMKNVAKICSPSRRRAIIWTKDGLVYWCIYTSLGLDEWNMLEIISIQGNSVNTSSYIQYHLPLTCNLCVQSCQGAKWWRFESISVWAGRIKSIGANGVELGWFGILPGSPYPCISHRFCFIGPGLITVIIAIY